MTTPLKVASYNIRKAIGRDARRDPVRILDLVAKIDADVVALQEADYRFKGRRAIFDPETIRHHTGLVPVKLANDGPGLGWHGNVLLVSSRLEIGAIHCLTLPGLEPRGGLLADAVVDGRPVRFVAAHLGLLARCRRQQTAAVLEAAQLQDDRATIVMGDFNGWGRTPGSLKLFGTEMQHAPCGRSYPSRRPVTPLDRIYYDGPVKLDECGVLSVEPARIASDHLPIWAEFSFGRGGDKVSQEDGVRARRTSRRIGRSPVRAVDARWKVLVFGSSS